VKPASILALPLFLSPLAFAQQATWSGTPIDPVRPATRLSTTYVTGELPGADVVFRVRFDPRVPMSGRVSVAAIEARHFELDGIDFVPGSPGLVVVGAPTGKLTKYDVTSGATLPDLVADTDAIAVPPATPGTWPSTVLTTPFHAYYIENQFGFGATLSHRIVRKPFAGGPEEVVYDGAGHGLENFEGLEIAAGRLYFFAADPMLADARALVSIGLTPMGLWNGLAPALEIGGLWEEPGPATDGSDELDFDPTTGWIFGTNIENGEVIAFNVAADMEMSSPGALHFIDGGQVTASAGSLALLGADVDGIRADGRGWLVFAGKGGVIGSIHIAGVMADGADDGDVNPIVIAPMASFDDLTPIRLP
jgi:hypothetical protein